MLDYKDLLIQRKHNLIKNLNSLKESSKPVDLNDPIGRLSRMDAIQQQQMALNSKKTIETNLLLIEQAMERLNNGDYGICLNCEEEIPEKRLLARPEAPFCTKCQK